MVAKQTPDSQEPPAQEDLGSQDTMVPSTVMAPPRASGPAIPATQQPRLAGRYEMRKMLGAGGMGEVYLCDDSRMGREVALKVLHPAVSHSSDARERFLREAQIQGRLDHSAVVPVYDLGELPGGAFFTMKRVEGLRLDAIVDRLADGHHETLERYPRRRLLTSFVSVCNAVIRAHEKGVLHRDLKPANIMLADYGEVYLLDWGVAKILGASEPLTAGNQPPGLDTPHGGNSSTRLGAIIGTLGYMSPEQARGETLDLDARSDVYSLGAVLFELLAWQPYHRAQTLRELLTEMQQPPDARPGLRAPEREIPPELDELCARALAAEREQRFASVRALAEALERYLDGDRDGALRKRLAEQRLEEAKADAERAKGEGEEAQKAHERAMREVTKALALDPDSEPAAALLAQLLLEAPTRLPPEAEQEFAAYREQRNRAASKLSFGRIAPPLIIMPLAMMAGVKDASYMALIGVLVLVAIGVNLHWLLVRRGESTGHHAIAALVAGSIVVAMASLVFSPFLFIPAALLIQSISTLVAMGFQRRRTIIAVSLVSLYFPLGMEFFGLLPPSFQVDTGHFTLLARATWFHPTWSPLLLTLLHSALLTMPLVLLGRFQDGALANERLVFLHAWHLRRLAGRKPAGEPERKGQA